MYITTDEEFVKEINKLNPALIECAEDLRKRIYESDLNYSLCSEIVLISNLI